MISRSKINSGFQKSFKQLEKKAGYSTKNIIIGAINFLILLCGLYGLISLYKKYYAIDYKTGAIVPVMKRPFLNLYAIKKDGSEITTNIIFITHSFTRDECETLYNEYKSKGAQFLGLSSYSEFPGLISNPHDVLHDPNNKAYSYDYFKLTRGWLTCFREENNKKWIKEGFPRINLTESDFANYEQHLPDPNIKKEYDFIYICLKDNDKCTEGWQSTVRRYDIAKKLIDIMCKKYKLKGLLIGRINCEVPPSCHQLMELTDFQEYSKFISNFNKCKFILTTSDIDASPRSLTEAICFNLPCLVNKKILGGWQYVNEQTGEFFDPDDIKGFEIILDKFLKKLNNNEYKPREWFIKNYGKYNSGKKLKAFVQSIFKEDELNIKYDEIEYMKPGI